MTKEKEACEEKTHEHDVENSIEARNCMICMVDMI